MVISVFIDGSCGPVNPGGVPCFGYLIYNDMKRLAQDYGVVNHKDPSNNVAEYGACIKALEKLREMNLLNEPIVMHSDSQLLIKQLRGIYDVNAPRIVPLYKQVKNIARSFRKIEFTWIPREKNHEADALCRKAYKEYVKKNLRSSQLKFSPSCRRPSFTPY